MANKSFELIEFPLSKTSKFEKEANALFEATTGSQSDLLRYMVGLEDEFIDDSPRVTVRIYALNPDGKPAIRIQM